MRFELILELLKRRSFTVKLSSLFSAKAGNFKISFFLSSSCWRYKNFYRFFLSPTCERFKNLGVFYALKKLKLLLLFSEKIKTLLMEGVSWLKKPLGFLMAGYNKVNDFIVYFINPLKIYYISNVNTLASQEELRKK
jgi:hypothetical protein